MIVAFAAFIPDDVASRKGDFMHKNFQAFHRTVQSGNL